MVPVMEAVPPIPSLFSQEFITRAVNAINIETDTQDTGCDFNFVNPIKSSLKICCPKIVKFYTIYWSEKKSPL